MKRTTLIGSLVTMALNVLACGGDPSLRRVGAGAEEFSPIERFTGRWSASGSQTYSIQTQSGPLTSTTPESGTVTIEEGVDSDLVFGMGNCTLPAKVKGSVTTLEPGYACMFSTEGGTLTLTVQAGTGGLSVDNMQLDVNGTLTYVASGGATYLGAWSWHYSMTRLTKG